MYVSVIKMQINLKLYLLQFLDYERKKNTVQCFSAFLTNFCPEFYRLSPKFRCVEVVSRRSLFFDRSS